MGVGRKDYSLVWAKWFNSALNDRLRTTERRIKKKHGSTIFFWGALQPNKGNGLRRFEVYKITHNDAPQSVGLL